MNWTRTAALTAALVAFAPVVPLQQAAAQPDPRKCANTEFAARSEPLGEFGPFAGASFKAEDYHDVDGPRCRIITFYRVAAPIPGATTPAQMRRIGPQYAGKTAPPFMAARYIDDSRGASYQPRWADQASCPALVTALEKLEPILAPKIVGEGPYRWMNVTSDGPNIRFWMNGQVYGQRNEDFTLNYALDGGHGSAFGGWLDETFKALEGCWSAQAPVIP
jgi:hypothetical protein